MKVYKDKQYLVFDFEDGRTCKYDFATKTNIGIKGKPVKGLQSQLQGMTINQLIEWCVDTKYANFLKYVYREEHRYGSWIENIGTILSRVQNYSQFEQIFSAGIDIYLAEDSNYYYHTSFKYSINEIPKSLIKLCRTYDEIKLTNTSVGEYRKNPNAHYVAFANDYISLDKDDIFKIWTVLNKSRNNPTSYFNMLITDYGYNAKDLWIYLDRLKTFEAIEDMKYLIEEIYDYAHMMKQISNKFDKYPRNFLTTHKIACRNYNRLQQEFSEELFKKRINKKYECSFGDYIFIYPKSTQDIKDEAVHQNNCVASYIDKVIDGKCHILFLRKKISPNDSLVTIEVQNDQIVQARRKFNDPVTEKDQEVIDKFNKKFATEKEKAA